MLPVRNPLEDLHKGDRNIANMTPVVAGGADQLVIEREERAALDRLIFDCTRGLAAPPPGVRLIPLTKGFFAAVDEADFKRVNAFKWQAKIKKSGHVYAVRNEYLLGTGRKSIKMAFIAMHRFILDAKLGELVDHRSGNGLQNTRPNIRRCTQSQNMMNRRASRTGYRGITKVKNRFRAFICVDGLRIRLGYFLTEIEAAQAYDSAARRYHGAFACLNFPVVGEQDASRSLHGEILPQENERGYIRDV